MCSSDLAFVEAGGDAVEDDAGGEFEVQGLSPEKMCHSLQVYGTLQRTSPV